MQRLKSPRLGRLKPGLSRSRGAEHLTWPSVWPLPAWLLGSQRECPGREGPERGSLEREQSKRTRGSGMAFYT